MKDELIKEILMYFPESYRTEVKVLLMFLPEYQLGNYIKNIKISKSKIG